MSKIRMVGIAAPPGVTGTKAPGPGTKSSPKIPPRSIPRGPSLSDYPLKKVAMRVTRDGTKDY